MERTPVAHAMDWSIELEKSFRSKNPGKSMEALKEIRSRLEWWNSEAELEAAEYRMFGLIPSEDKLFLNAIFLRLADAFRFGNKKVKMGVVELFRAMRRSRRRKMRKKEGIFSKGKLENYVELLQRVKGVFDGGDVEERGLALVLFGCWMDFAKDSADIQYIVLSSLVSGDVLEVKAALFAAGCLCEISDSFAHIFLEILTTMVRSPEVPGNIKVAGAQAFAKMWCSFSIAEKAYKTGFTLLMESSEDDFSEVMLISLSKIAARWMLLIPNQIEVLSSFLGDEKSLCMQATSLKCHLFILARGLCSFHSIMDMVHKLFSVLHSSDYPPVQLQALKVLHKIILSNLFIIPSTEMPKFFHKLMVVVDKMLPSSLVSTKILSISILSDISGKLLGSKDLISDRTSSSLAFQVISFVFDRTFLLLTARMDVHHQPDLTVELQVKSLLSLVFNLVEHSHLRCLVLNNTCLFIDKLMKMPDKFLYTEKNGLSDLVLKVIFCVSKIVGACLPNLEETNAETSIVLDALKLQLENVSCCSYLDSYSHMSYFLLSHMHAVYISLQQIEEQYTSLRNLSCLNSILQLDVNAENCANKMLERNSYWSCYKAGKLAASQGAWSAAALIFEQLKTVVQSASCSCWLKSLALFSTSEKQIQLFLLRDQAPSIVSRDYEKNLLRNCDALLTAEEILEASGISDVFSFQRWFLTLRAKVLKTVVDIMKLLDNVLSVLQLERSTLHPCTASAERSASLINSSTQISFQLRKLAEEFDLLLTSSTDIDRQSRMTISAHALTCSLMAFTVGFSFLIPNVHSTESHGVPKFGGSKENLHALLIEDLFARLRIDGVIRTNLLFLLKSLRNYKRCFVPQSRSQISNSYEARLLKKLCKCSIKGIITMQSKAKPDQLGGEIISQIVSDGSQLLFNITSRLLLIPFRTPCHFFRTRPLVSSELFVMDQEGKHVEGVSVLSGSQFSLNLCLQLKNIPPSLKGQVTKVFCILSFKNHSNVTTKEGGHKERSHFSRRCHEINDMVDMNEKLIRHVNGAESHGVHRKVKTGDEYVCFQLNGRGQGFSTCLLDVSALLMGFYRMKWHCGFIDGGGSYWSPPPLNPGPLFTVYNAV